MGARGLAIWACVAAVGCSGPSSWPTVYDAYECAQPIGMIVREDCSRIALRYEGVTFEGSVGPHGLGASGSRKEEAVRQADDLLSLLEDQRVDLCNDFNTCKLDVQQYRAEKARLEGAFIALLGLKERMAALDAESARKLLQEVDRIRARLANTEAAPPGPWPPPTPPRAVPAAPMPEGSAEYDFEEANYWSGEMARLSNVTDPQVCARACEKHPMCKVASYHDATATGGWARTCVLRPVVANRHTEQVGIRSWVKPGR